MANMGIQIEGHEHCQTCINITRCRKWTTKNDSSCDLVHCHLDCGATFHACKRDEHALLCSREKVTCINSGYGCPVIVERRNKGKHLQLCPASVVHCSMTYDHWPIALVENVMPQVSNGHRITTQGQPDMSLSDEDNTHQNGSGLKLTTFSEISVSVKNRCLFWKSFKPFTLNPKEHYTFSCSRDFQRLEYEWHFRNTHSDLQSCLYDWVEQWCPLAQYGCKFTRKRLQPCLQVNKNIRHKQTPSKLVFSQHLQAFGVSNDDTVVDLKGSNGVPNEADGRSGEDLLSRLPCEVLLVIASHLDSFSLNNLSLTSKYFYSVCQSLLTQKGIVLPHWERSGQENSWKVTNYRWKFTVACAPVHSWCIADCPSMSAHMHHCPYFASSLQTEENVFSADKDESRHNMLTNVISEYAAKHLYSS